MLSFRIVLVLIVCTISANCKYINGKPNKTLNINDQTARKAVNGNWKASTVSNGTYLQAKGIHIFINMFSSVSTPFVICCWILLVSIAQVIFHSVDWLSSTIPDSCLLILLGIPVGFILNAAGVTGHFFLTSDLFFQYLLPPIIFDAGYFINPTSFFNNIGTILLYAVIGTIANTFLVGASMYGIAVTTDINISLLNSFLFGSLISAVDPVAVLTVFEEVQVNEVLYMLVFGESVLNDAASVVLYRIFESVPDYFDGEQVGLAIVSFFVVSIFGTAIGVIYGLLASFITKFTDHVRVIEPLFIFIMAWMAYLTAEMFHFSGIMSILFCGVVMKPYVESNISRKSHTTTKYFLKLLAGSCEAVIFLFLGVALVQYSHNFNIKFIAWCIFCISIYRVIAIVSLTWLANKFGRLEKVSKIEQLIMSYGGLRGAVAFCLAIVWSVDKQTESLKSLFVTTTLAVIIFTCFVQGATMKKLVEKLGVKRADQREHCMFEHLNDKVMSYTMAGVEELLGVHGHGFWMNVIERFNHKVLRRCLERNPEMYMDDSLFQAERKIEYKSSISSTSLVSHTGDGSNKNSARESPLESKRPSLVHSMSSHSVTAGLSALVGTIDFATLIPDVAKVKPRRKYTDAHVGLHHLQYQLEDLHDKNTKRDAYGNKMSEQQRHAIIQHHRDSIGYHHHHGHNGHHGHHGYNGHHRNHEHNGHHKHHRHHGHHGLHGHHNSHSKDHDRHHHHKHHRHNKRSVNPIPENIIEENEEEGLVVKDNNNSLPKWMREELRNEAKALEATENHLIVIPDAESESAQKEESSIDETNQIQKSINGLPYKNESDSASEESIQNLPETMSTQSVVSHVPRKDSVEEGNDLVIHNPYDSKGKENGDSDIATDNSPSQSAGSWLLSGATQPRQSANDEAHTTNHLEYSSPWE